MRPASHRASCSLGGRCSGCPWIDRGYASQLEAKRQTLRRLLAGAGIAELSGSAISIISAGEQGLRDRVDLALRLGPRGPILGMHDLERREVLDIPVCPQLSPALAAWHACLRERLPEVGSASLRLRVSPAGDRGVWLDLSRRDLAALLEAAGDLQALLAVGLLEAGQRHHRVVDGPAGPALAPALLHPWFETYLGPGERPVPLYLPIGGFSQPGFAPNRLLVREVRRAAASTGATGWLELGAGSGNFTLPLASDGAQVVALELDPLLREGLARSLDETGLVNRVEVVSANLRHGGPSLAARLAGAEAVLADPPRSGLEGTLVALAALERAARPPHIVYVSCLAERLAADLRTLRSLGYRLRAVRGVDLFPQGPHAEWIAVLGR